MAVTIKAMCYETYHFIRYIVTRASEDLTAFFFSVEESNNRGVEGGQEL
jgi:hypothetical protein